MSDEGWIAIVGWNRLTHSDAKRGDGPLPWHRTYASLLDDDGYLSLSAKRRAILHGIWLLYAASMCRLSASPGRVGARLGIWTGSDGAGPGRSGVRRGDLEALADAGFIRICASIEQVARWHGTSPRVAREDLEREKYSYPSSRSKTTGDDADYQAGSLEDQEIETESTNSNPLPSWVPRAL